VQTVWRSIRTPKRQPARSAVIRSPARRQSHAPSPPLSAGFVRSVHRPSRPINSRDSEAIAEESKRLLSFAAAGTAGHHLRIVNLP
jgi:hypothetical protein